ncbi:MAG: hypothetical protein EPO31_03805 [Gammaproteobacteria bacterium]|jgi:hypothetical protein|nr:MAG: hypothetical protein EPO31_03805 [Gammaproteobacteria bacterium]
MKVFSSVLYPVILLVPFVANAVGAAETPVNEEKRIVATRIDTPPIIDGRLDDAAWQQATVIEDLHQVAPHEYEQPGERTIFYIMYDKDALYVGVRAWDSNPQAITARVLKQGDMLMNEDRVGIVLSPFNDKRSGFMFEVNPNGVRLDGLFNGPTEFAPNWDGIWEGDAELTGDGYTVEFAIPFKTLSFDEADETWGLNVWRQVMRNDEMMGWVSHNRAFNPAASGEMTGMTDLDIGKGLDIVPSMSMRRKRDIVNGKSDWQLEPSLDVYYRITPSLNGLLTYNTDFSATEVDERQVNLTRFGLFFPEKRDFFLKDSDIFEFGNTGNEGPFFSRRIGLSPRGEPINLDFGGKLSGRIGAWNIGALAVRQEGTGTLKDDDLLVARISHNVFEESSLGGIFTYGDPVSDRDNALAGIDFRYLNTRLANGKVISGELWYQQTHTEGLENDNAAWGAGIHMPNSESWYGNFSIKEFQKNYNPALGFITRHDVRDTFANVGYIYRPRDIEWLREISAGFDFRNVTRLGDEKLQTQFMLLKPMEFANFQGDRLQLRILNIKEGLDAVFMHPLPAKDVRNGKSLPLQPGLYSFYRYGVWMESSPARPISGMLEVFNGEYFNGQRFSVEGALTWRPNMRFSLGGAFDFNDFTVQGLHFITRQYSLKSDIVFSNTLSWTNILQFDNVSDNLGINSRLHWIPQAGRNVYFVINYNAIDSEEGFRSTASELTFKANYTFRF